LPIDLLLAGVAATDESLRVLLAYRQVFVSFQAAVPRSAVALLQRPQEVLAQGRARRAGWDSGRAKDQQQIKQEKETEEALKKVEGTGEWRRERPR
jgi:hypothetical protein